MDHEFMASGAWMLLALLLSAGAFGLLTCRATLRSTTVSGLRREAGISMLRQANFSSLSGSQRAAASAALFALAYSHEPSKRTVPSLGATGYHAPLQLSTKGR